MKLQEFIESTKVELIRLAEPSHQFSPQSKKWVKQLGGEVSKETQYYKLRLQFERRTFDFNYSQGCGHEKHPTLEAVLECLQMDANTETGSINDFMSEFGYTDAEEAQGVMLALNKNRRGLKKLFAHHWNDFLNMEID